MFQSTKFIKYSITQLLPFISLFFLLERIQVYSASLDNVSSTYNSSTLCHSNLTKRAPISFPLLLSIPITSSLPSTEGLSPSDPLLLLWEEVLKSLASDSIRLTASSIASAELESDRILGIPGTAIDTIKEAKELQDYLDCSGGKGEWRQVGEEGGKIGLTVHKQQGVYSSCDKMFFKGKETMNGSNKGSWDVRESLKWEWIPSPSCTNSFISSETIKPLSRKRLCTLLAHKATLIVGDTPQYSLHDLLLDWTSMAPQTCYGDLYCKEHRICREVLSKNKEGIEDWEKDERVHNRLPNAPGFRPPIDEVPLPGSHKKIEGAPAHETLLRYRRSDGLKVGNSYTTPDYIHPVTGIREINMPWLADSRRSDLVIISKPPLPLPSRGLNSTWDILLDGEEEAGKEGMKMIEAAWKITSEFWLPELLYSLTAMRSKENPDRLVVYRGAWRSHADCSASSLSEEDEGFEMEWTSPGDGPPPRRHQPSLRTLLFPSSKSKKLTNPHTLFFNLQTIHQNHILRQYVLPTFGIPFLDLETPLSVWRSGMIGSASSSFSPSFIDQNSGDDYHHGANIGLRSSTSGDCSRYCFPSPGLAVEEVFLGGLQKVFEFGWGRDEEKWVGKKFVSVKDRDDTNRK